MHLEDFENLLQSLFYYPEIDEPIITTLLSFGLTSEVSTTFLKIFLMKLSENGYENALTKVLKLRPFFDEDTGPITRSIYDALREKHSGIVKIFLNFIKNSNLNMDAFKPKYTLMTWDEMVRDIFFQACQLEDPNLVKFLLGWDNEGRIKTDALSNRLSFGSLSRHVIKEILNSDKAPPIPNSVISRAINNAFWSGYLGVVHNILTSRRVINSTDDLNITFFLRGYISVIKTTQNLLQSFLPELPR